jgi:hypothetical protein
MIGIQPHNRILTSGSDFFLEVAQVSGKVLLTKLGRLWAGKRKVGLDKHQHLK